MKVFLPPSKDNFGDRVVHVEVNGVHGVIIPDGLASDAASSRLCFAIGRNFVGAASKNSLDWSEQEISDALCNLSLADIAEYNASRSTDRAERAA